MSEEDKTEEKSPEDLIDEALADLDFSDMSREEPENESEESEMSETEQKAYEMGWRPKGEHKGDKPWIDAEEFIGRQPLYDGLSKANKRVKSLEEKVQKLLEHNSKVEQASYERAMKELKAERDLAVEQGRVEDVNKLDEQQKELEAQAPQQDDEANYPPEFLEWREENTWYTEDAELQVFADAIAPGMKQKHPNLGPREFFDLITDTVKKANPDKFDPPKKRRQIPEGGDAPQSKGKADGVSQAKSLWNKMTPEEQHICREWDRDGTMSKADYMKQLDLKNR